MTLTERMNNEEVVQEQVICQIRHQLLVAASNAIYFLPVAEVMGLVGSAYRTLPAGSLLAKTARDVAEEIEIAGASIDHKYGI